MQHAAENPYSSFFHKRFVTRLFFEGSGWDTVALATVSNEAHGRLFKDAGKPGGAVYQLRGNREAVRSCSSRT